MLDMYEAWLRVDINGKAKYFQLARKDGSPQFLTQGSAEKAVRGALESAHKGLIIKRSTVREYDGLLKPGELPEQIRKDLEALPDHDGIGIDQDAPPERTPDGTKDDIM